MNPKVLTGRRKVKPIKSRPCKVPDYIFTFEGGGAPYIEPGFGVVLPRGDEPDSVPDAHGVAHYITRDDFLQIVKTEGGGGHEELGYSVIPVTCVFTDNEVPESRPYCLTLGAGRKDFVRKGVIPSYRYWKLVWEGAHHGNVDKEYIQWLESLDWYRPETLGKKIGKYLMFAIFFVLVVPAFAASKIASGFPGSLDYYIQCYYINPLRIFWWGVHDLFLRFIFGNGCNNSDVKLEPKKIPIYDENTFKRS